MSQFSTTQQLPLSPRTFQINQPMSPIAEDSQLDFNPSPIQVNEIQKIGVLPRKNSEKILKTIQNKLHFGPNSNQTARDSNNFSKNTSINDKSLNRSQSSSQFQNPILGSHQTKLKDQRSSIYAYNKRVVELNLNTLSNSNLNSQSSLIQASQQQRNQKGLNKNGLSTQTSLLISSSQQNSGLQSKIISFDMGETLNKQIPQSQDDSNKKRKHQSQYGKGKNEGIKKQMSINSSQSSICLQNFPKNSTLSVQISPKQPSIKNLFSQQRYSESKVNQLSTVVSKQINLKDLSQERITLNRSEMNLLSPVQQQQQQLNHSKQSTEIQPINRSTSPDLSKVLKIKEIDSLKKAISGRAELLRNLSSDRSTTLKAHISIKDLNSPPKKTQEINSSKSTHQLRIQDQKKNQNIKTNTLNPQSITINKALSRISSIGDLKTMKEQLGMQRKSININNNSHKLQSTVTTVNSRATDVGTFVNQYHKTAENTQLFSDSEEDGTDFISNQEKLWNAIESKQSIQVIKELLMRKDVDCEAKNKFNDGWSAIHYAVQEGYLEAVQLLLEQFNVNIDSRTQFNKTPFHFACRRGDEQIIRYLLEKGASTQVVDRDGYTPLHYLCEIENQEMIKLILPHCKQMKDVRNKFGKKPSDLINSHEIKKMIRNLSNRRSSNSHSGTRTTSARTEIIPQPSNQLKQLQVNSKENDQRSTSRGNKNIVRNKNSHQVKVHQVNDENAGINQLFSKFAMYKHARQFVEKTQQLHSQQSNRQGQGQQSERKIFSNSNERQKVMVSQQSQKTLISQGSNPKLVSSPNSTKNYVSQQSMKIQSSNVTQRSQNVNILQNSNSNKQMHQAIPSSCKNIPSKMNQQKSIFSQQKVETQSTRLTQQQQKPIVFNYSSQNNGVMKTNPQTIKKQLMPSASQQLLHNPQTNSTNNAKSKIVSQHTKMNQGTQQRIDSITKQIDQVLKQKQQQLQQQQNLINNIQFEDLDSLEDEDVPFDMKNNLNQSESPDRSLSQERINNQYHSNNVQSKNKLLSHQQSREKLQNSSSQKTGDSSEKNKHVRSNSKSNNQYKLKEISPSKDNNNDDDCLQEKIGPSSFIAHQLLGTGSFGEVYLVEKISNGQYYAMKVLTKSKIMGNNLTRYAMTERNVLSIADHPFIVKLNYAFQTQEKLFLILDYCSGGDLAEYLQLEKRFNEDKTRLYSAEILLAIEELHRKDIIFRDLKPDNVVLDSEGHALLTDFGLSKEGVIQEGVARSFCGSYAYLAPEMLKKQGHGKAVDWYLLGVCIYEMLCGVPPYYANNKDELFENIKNAQLDIPSYVSPLAKDLIIKLLNRNPKKRLGSIRGADEIKVHPFFKAINWDKCYQKMYIPPEPYLRKRFENFLRMSPLQQTNQDAYNSLKKEKVCLKSDDQHIPGWSFLMETSFDINSYNNNRVLNNPYFDQPRYQSNPSTKQYIYDLNKIENKLQKFELKAPSSSAYQSQMNFRSKNLESSEVKQILKQPQEPFADLKRKILEKQIITPQKVAKQEQIQRVNQIQKPPPSQLFSKQESELKIPKINEQLPSRRERELVQKNQVLQRQALDILPGPSSQFASTSYSKMHDFRKSSLQSQQRQMSNSDFPPIQKKQLKLQDEDQPFKSLHQGTTNEQLTQSKRFRNMLSNDARQAQQKKNYLEPILENENAQISQLPPRSRDFYDPDNNILFLDNGSRIVNPTNAKTPPPPMWGEEIEEDNYDPNEEFYNHEKAEEEKRKRIIVTEDGKTKHLKKKVVYIYESDSSEDENGQKKPKKEVILGDVRHQKSIIDSAYSNTNNQPLGVGIVSKRQNSIEPLRQQKPLESPFLSLLSRNLNSKDQGISYGKQPSIGLIKNNGQSIRSTGVTSGAPQSRQIRTGGFQILPRIKN